MRVLVVDHGHTTRCGIRDLGVRMAQRLGAAHADCSDAAGYEAVCRGFDAVIVNYRADLMPWWRPTSITELAVLHNYGPTTVDVRSGELLGRGFDRVLVLDPTVTSSDPRVHAVGRPLPSEPTSDRDSPLPPVSFRSVDSPDQIRIGSFGFAFPHKGFADVAAEVATIPGATYALHMPEAFFNGANGGLLYTEGILADVMARLGEHRLTYTNDELSPSDLVDSLAANTVNCLLYQPGQPDAGLSSAVDYLIAAGRPMLVSTAEMFAAAAGWAAEWPAARLADVIDHLGHWEHQADLLFKITADRFEDEMRIVLDSL